jgi:signal peptidase I
MSLGKRRPASDEASRPGSLRGLAGLLIVAVVLALLIKALLVQVFFIPSGSMEPTLTQGDRILVNRVSYRLHDIGRGDVIVFSNPNGVAVDRGLLGAAVHWIAQGLGLASGGEGSCPDPDPDEDFIKRVIGLPHDTVAARGGAVYVDGNKLDEPYLPQGVRTAPFRARVVPSGDLFVMGDNRGNSCDSRFALGYVPLDHVIGRAFVVVWPPGRIGSLT